MQYELFLVGSFITVQYELLLAASFVVLCIGSEICYWAICALSGSVNYYCVICSVLAVSFVTVQYEVCHALSVFTECELCLTVICYVLFLAVSFITVQYELFLAV